MNNYKIEIKTTTTKEYNIKANNLEEAYDKISKEGIVDSNAELISLKHEISYREPIIKNNEFLKDKDGMVLSFFDIPRSDLNKY